MNHYRTKKIAGHFLPAKNYHQSDGQKVKVVLLFPQQNVLEIFLNCNLFFIIKVQTRRFNKCCVIQQLFFLAELKKCTITRDKISK